MTIIKQQISKISKSLKLDKVNIFESKGGNLLNNRFVLYFIFFISILNLYYYAISGNYFLAIVFILVGFMTSFYSKNMIVILCISLVISGIFQYGTSVTKEGFEEGEENITPTVEKEDDVDMSTAEIDVNVGSGSQKFISTGSSASKLLDGGLAKIHDDTTDLIAAQNQLIDNMNKLEPLINKAESFVEKFGSMKSNNVPNM